jgi:HAAS
VIHRPLTGSTEANVDQGSPPGIPQNADALRLWSDYLDDASRVARRLPETERRELVLELRSHLAESFAVAGEPSDPDEVARVKAAIARLGRPRDFLRPILADHLLEQGASTFHPRLLAEGLYHNVFGGLKAGIISVAFAVGYVLIIVFAAMALMKAFVPSHVGYFVYPNGTRTFGILTDTTGAREALGYWVVPLALAAATVLYVLLTLGLRAARRFRG